jgi:hypothetical protein
MKEREKLIFYCPSERESKPRPRECSDAICGLGDILYDHLYLLGTVPEYMELEHNNVEIIIDFPIGTN